MDSGTERSTRSILSGSGFRHALPVWLALLLFCATPAVADIYRWVDEQGTIHFTDQLSNVPRASRKSAVREVSEAAKSAGTLSVLEASPLPPEGESGAQAIPPAAGTAPQGDREELLSRIEQLRAKIEAKEWHLQAVDAKQSLAVNPLRNRYVDEADLALYRKYQEELPADREELVALEEALSSLR